MSNDPAVLIVPFHHQRGHECLHYRATLSLQQNIYQSKTCLFILPLLLAPQLCSTFTF